MNILDLYTIPNNKKAYSEDDFIDYYLAKNSIPSNQKYRSFEKDGQVLLFIEAVGAKEEDITVTENPTSMTLTVEYKSSPIVDETWKPEVGSSRSSWSSGFTGHWSIKNLTVVSAELEAGLLKIVLEKTESKNLRTIAVGSKSVE